MSPRYKKRTVQYGDRVMGVSKDYYGNISETREPSYLGGFTLSDETHPGPPYRTGGPFALTKKRYFISRSKAFSSHYSPGFGWYDGYVLTKPYEPSPGPSPLNLSGWGAKGWNRGFPLHPIYQLGVSLVELKDVPRMLTQTKELLSTLRGLAFSRKPTTVGRFLRDLSKGPEYISSHYLNLQFGWVPVIQDLLFLASMQEKLDKKLAWLKKHNGKATKSSFVLDSGSYSEVIPRNVAGLTTCFPPFTTYLYLSDAFTVQDFSIRKSYEYSIWFEAKWRYMIPELNNYPLGSRDLSGLKRELLGLALDPTILYKVTPWSWLLDWFTPAGAIVQNMYLRAKYHVVAEYAYVMASEKLTYSAPGYVGVETGQFQYTPTYHFDGPPLRHNGISSVVYEMKQRAEANPYGFGITFAGLSQYQWSILAALGLSRARFRSGPRA